MKLNETLDLVALYHRLDADELKRYAVEDTHTGWDKGAGAWPIGSLWAVEGKTLYALVRALKPAVAVEIGTHRGASATHIATALARNGKGSLIAIDLNEGAGDMIEAQLKDIIAFVHQDGVAWLAAQEDNSIDFIFEDGDHSTDMVAAVARLAKEKLAPGGVLVVHDAAHFLVGEAVRDGLTQAAVPFSVHLAEPSDCGLGIYRKPLPENEDEDTQETIVTADGAVLDVVEEMPEKPKTTSKRKAKVS